MYTQTVVKNSLQNKFGFLALIRMIKSPTYNNMYMRVYIYTYYYI